MTPWFEVEQLAGDTYAISEYKHWEEPHCYLLCGCKRAVLIDTGLGIAPIEPIAAALTELPIEVLTTHVHWDHIGGHADFAQTAVFPSEAAWLAGAFPLPLEVVKKQLMQQPCDFPPEFVLEDFSLRPVTAAHWLRDGEMIDLGGRTLEVVHTPGTARDTAVFMKRRGARCMRATSFTKAVSMRFIPPLIPCFLKSRWTGSVSWPSRKSGRGTTSSAFRENLSIASGKVSKDWLIRASFGRGRGV